MKIYVSRKSVAAGDDVNAPNSETIPVPDELSIEEIIDLIAKSGYLPSISGGEASWSVASNIPLAVVAQQWSKPRMLNKIAKLDDLDYQDGVLRLSFNYHAQVDPEDVYRILWGFSLRAI